MSKSSDYEQGRINRMTDHGRTNTVVDPTSFKAARKLVDELVDEKRKIIEEKTRVEIALSKVNASIDRAMLNSRINGRAVKSASLSYLKQKQSELKSSVHKLRENESDLRLRIAALQGTYDHFEKVSFERAFYVTARQLLAGPVFERIKIAAVHAMLNNDET